MSYPVGHKINSVEYIFEKNQAKDEIIKGLSSSYLNRKAVTHLLDQDVGQLEIIKDATGNLQFKIWNTVVDLTQETGHEPSLCERLSHWWDMTFDDEYKEKFIKKLDLVYSAFESFKASEEADAKELELQAEAAAKAQAALDALAAAKEAKKQARIVELNTEIPAKQGELTACTTILADAFQVKTTDDESFNQLKAKQVTLEKEVKDKKIWVEQLKVLSEQIGENLFGLEKSNLDMFAKIFNKTSEEFNTKEERTKAINSIITELNDSITRLSVSKKTIKDFNAIRDANQAKIDKLTAKKEALEKELAALTQELNDLQPASVEAAVEPPIVVEAPPLEEVPLRTQIEFMGLQSDMGKYLHEIVKKPTDKVTVENPALANFITALFQGRDLIVTVGSSPLTHQIAIKPGKATIDSALLKGELTLPANLSLEYSKKTNSWKLTGDIILERDGSKRALKEAVFKLDDKNNFVMDIVWKGLFTKNTHRKIHAAAIETEVIQPGFIHWIETQ